MTVPGWTAVIVNYNGAGYIEACLSALAATRQPPADIIVVDNASTDDSLQELHAFPRVNLLAQRVNLGFAGGANVGLAAVETEFALLMNPDVEVDADSGSALLAAFNADARLGQAGCLLRYPDSDRIQHAGGVIERPLMTTSHVGYGQPVGDVQMSPSDVDFVTGGAVGLRMTAFAEVGGFDEAFSPVYYEDVDLSVRIRDAGWHVRLIPTLRAVHHEGVTLQQSDSYFRYLHRNRIRFALKHLSGHEWRTSFVPAELERLRYELRVVNDAGWPARSGAEGIEALLRGYDDHEGWATTTMLQGPPLATIGSRIETVRELAAIATSDPNRWDRPGMRLLAKLRDIGLRGRVGNAIAQQRRFNETLVEILEAQDRINREQTAMSMMMALDILGRLQRLSASETADPQAD